MRRSVVSGEKGRKKNPSEKRERDLQKTYTPLMSGKEKKRDCFMCWGEVFPISISSSRGFLIERRLHGPAHKKVFYL